METVTAGLVGMEINVNSSVISPPGRASEDARLQMAKSAVTEVCHSFTLLQMGGGKLLIVNTPFLWISFSRGGSCLLRCLTLL